MRGLLTAAVVLAVASSACGLTRVDAPISFRSDRRLDIVSPEDESDVDAPITVRWTVEDFSVGDGNHFGVFLDRAPLGQRRTLRMRICSENEQKPIVPGEDRQPCHDDRERVFFTDEMSFTFPCIEPRDNQPKRLRNRHQVTVILLDAQKRRVGKAADSVTFDVDESDARRCEGL